MKKFYITRPEGKNAVCLGACGKEKFLNLYTEMLVKQGYCYDDDYYAADLFYRDFTKDGTVAVQYSLLIAYRQSSPLLISSFCPSLIDYILEQ